MTAVTAVVRGAMRTLIALLALSGIGWAQALTPAEERALRALLQRQAQIQREHEQRIEDLEAAHERQRQAWELDQTYNRAPTDAYIPFEDR